MEGLRSVVDGVGTGNVGQCGLFAGGVERVEFGGKLFRREWCCGVRSGFGESYVFLCVSCQFPCSEPECCENRSALLDGVVAVEVCF